MRYISTTGVHSTDLRGALTNCFSPDGSLYLPERLPVIPRALFNNIEEMTIREIAYVVVTSLLGEDIGPAELKRVVDDTYIYKVPFRELSEGIDVIELFEGPTLAFKDFSAGFVSNIIMPSSRAGLAKVAIVATTGNTGAAVASAFARHHDRHVAVLFPHGALNRRQLAQITTNGPHIHALEVAGDIEKCKEMVRDAMSDESLSSLMTISSLNSANYLKIVPQVALFFYAYSRLKAKYGEKGARGFSPALPCGNLSLLTSAVIAKRLGLPMGEIIAGCSANDDLVRVLSGELSPDNVNHSSRTTLARAMDSGYPTNLGRVLRLYDNDIARARGEIRAASVSDREIADIIRRHADEGYFADPHTAVALGAIEKAGEGAGRKVVFATAHPAKSLDTMTDITGRAFELPLQMTRFMAAGKPAVKIPPSYAALRKFLVKTINSPL